MLNTLLSKLRDSVDGNTFNKVRTLLTLEPTVYDKSYEFPNRGGDVAVVWYLFGLKPEYIYLGYYSVVSFLRRTDLKDFDRYICVPEDYDFMEYMPLFEELGFKIHTSSYHFKALKPDSSLIDKYDYLITLDTDIYSFDVSGNRYPYFEGIEDLIKSYRKIGVRLPFMCASLNTGFGHHINRLSDIISIISEEPEKTRINKYIWGSEHYDGETAFDNIITTDKSDDILFILNSIVDYLSIPFTSEDDKKNIVENAYNKFLCHPWPVNEIFSYPTEIFKKHGIHEIIKKFQSVQHWFWDDELVYKLYYTLYVMDDTFSFTQLMGYNHFDNTTNRVYANDKDENLKPNTLYFTHPFNELDVDDDDSVITLLKRISYMSPTKS